MPLRFPRPPHAWSLSPRAAVAVQRRLASRVTVQAPSGPLRYVAGLDAAFSIDGQQCLAAAVLWDREQQSVVEERLARRPLRFPYVPGLLSFREAPALLAALRRLDRCPDVLLCDGQGLAHPRRFGIACHLGVLCGLPAIGCAKSVLVGTFQPPGPERGASQPLRWRDDIIGQALRTQHRIRPVFVSVGHLIDLPSACRLVLDCAGRFRLPEPTRLADRAVARERRRCPR